MTPFRNAQAEAIQQQKRLSEAESTAVSHRAEAASLFRQAEAARQEVANARQSRSEVEAELRGQAIGFKADAQATVEALRSQLAASSDKLRR